MANANRSKTAQADQGTKVTVSMIESLQRKIAPALAIAILSASDDPSSAETHKEAARAVADILSDAIEYLDELALKAGKVAQA